MIPIASPDLGEDEQKAVRAVIESGQLADGPEVRAFEEEFAATCEVAHGVATANGTAALHAALVAVGVEPGDTVLTTPFSFVATANAIRLCGATPEFVDIDPRTYNIDPDALEARLRGGEPVDALVPVHLYGLPAAIDRIVALADEYDLRVVEDAAQAHGAAIDGRPVGSFGDAACFSFYPTKNMTTGEGGMITTDDAEVARRAARFVNHGRDVAGYTHIEVGHNFRLTSIGAAIGRVQLEKLPGYTERRRENARRLTELLADADVVTPFEPDGYRHVYHQYTVATDDRDGLERTLSKAGVGTGVYYPIPIHRQPAYADLDCSMPESERAAERVLSLPVHPKVTDADIERVASAVRAAIRGETR